MIATRARVTPWFADPSHGRRLKEEAALEVLYPAVSEGSRASFGSAYELAQTFISNLRNLTISHDVQALMTNELPLRSKTDELPADCSYRRQPLFDASMQAILDQSFRVIEPYIDELNHKVDRTELRLGCTSPQWVDEDSGVTAGFQSRSYYRARVSTSKLSIVMRGSSGKVEFFVLPSSLVMGLSKVEDAYQALMTFATASVAAGSDWQVEGKPLSQERLAKYCLMLFNYLLEETQAELDNSN